MSNGNQEAPKSLTDMINAISAAGTLDQAPQESPLTLTEKINAINVPTRKFVQTTEPGLAGFGKGLLHGIVSPFRVFDIDPNLEPRQPSGLPALPATGSRILGEFLGAAAPIIVSTGAASAAIGYSGLQAAMGPAVSRVIADAVGFGLFEAGRSERGEDVPENFAQGAAIGAVFGIGHNILAGKLRGRSISDPEYEIIMTEGRFLPAGPRQIGPGQRQIPSGARPTGEARPVPPGGFETTRPPTTPKGAGGGGPAVSPLSGRVIPVESAFVGEPINISPKLYERLLERSTGAAKAALEAAAVTAKGAVVQAGTAARVQLRAELESLLNEGAGAVARPAARLRGTLAEVVPGSIDDLKAMGLPVLQTGDTLPPTFGLEAADDILVPGGVAKGMRYGPQTAGATFEFDGEATLTRNVGGIPAGTRVQVGETGSSLIVRDPNNKLAAPVPVGGQDLRNVIEPGMPGAPNETVSYPLALLDDGGIILPQRDDFGIRGLRRTLGVTANDVNGNRIIDQQNLPPILQKIVGENSNAIVLTESEGRQLRDAAIWLKSRIANTVPHKYSTENSLELLGRAERFVLPQLLSMLRVYDPTLDEIVSILGRAVIEPGRRIPANLATYGERIFAGRDTPGMVYIHPDAYKLETQFFQNRTQRDVFESLGFALNENDQLLIAAARVGAAFNKGGTSVITGVRNPAELIAAVKRFDPMLQTAVHEYPNRYTSRTDYDVLLSHPVIRGPRSLIRQSFQEEMLGIIQRTLKDPLTPDDVLAVLRAPLEGELAPRVPIIEGFDTHQLSTGAFGTYTADLETLESTRSAFEPPEFVPGPEGNIPGAVIRMGKIEEASQKIGTYAHEYTHHMFAAIANRAKVDPDELIRIHAETGTEAGIDYFGMFPQVIDWWKPTPEQYKKVLGGAIDDEIGIETNSEVVEVAIQVRARTNAHDLFTPIENGSPAWVEAFDQVKAGVENFRSDTELAARLYELMVVDMGAAKELAPTATKLFVELANTFSPRMSLLLRGQTVAKIGDIIDEKALVGRMRALHPVEEYSRAIGVITEDKLKQFSQTGVFDGMPVKYQGKVYIAKKRSGDKLVIADPYTGDTFIGNWNHTSRPGDIGFVEPTRLLPSLIKDMTERLPREIGIVVEDPESGMAWRRAFSFSEENARFYEGYGAVLDELIRANPELETLTLLPSQIESLLHARLAKTGKTGVINDDGAYKLILDRPLEPARQQRFIQDIPRPRDSFDRVNAKVGDTVVDLDPRTVAEGWLAGKVNDRDLPILVDELAQGMEWNQYLNLDPEHMTLVRAVHPEVPRTVEEATNLAKMASAELGFKVDPVQLEGGLYTRSLSEQAARQGAQHSQTVDGHHRVHTDANDFKRDAGVFETTEDYYDYLRRIEARRQQMGGLSDKSVETETLDGLGNRENVGRGGIGGEPPPPGGNGTGGPKSTGSSSTGGPGLGGGGGARPPNFGATMDGQSPPNSGWLSRLADTTQFFGAFVTAMENTAKIIERRMGLPAFTRIFQPLQEAIRTVDRSMKAPNAILGGKSYHDQLKTIEKLLWKVHAKEKREQIIRWLEAMSKEEIAARGGLLRRGMTAEELKASAFITRLGLQHDVPYLISTWRMLSNAMRGRKDFMKQYNRLMQQELDPKVTQNLRALREATKNNAQWEFDALARHIGMSGPQIDVMKMIEATSKFSKDRFSIYAVSRHAAARNLPLGAKSMRDVVARELKMNPLQLKVGAEMDKLFKASFAEAGIDPKRYLGGYFPHLRQFEPMGITPDSPYIKDVFPKASTFTANKFRSGELDPYSMEPLKVAYKHVRGVLMHKHFDPHMKDVRVVLRELSHKDTRAFRLMNEYVRELQGKPHASFVDLQKVIEGAAKIMGTSVDRNLSTAVVNSIAGVTYSATIPFRAALIARNYFQMVQMIAPRIGFSDFIAGLRIAMTKEGRDMAKAANAVTENVAPIMSQEAMFNFANLRLSQRMQRLSEVGFRWYQKADDIGRAAAFHGQRVRTGRAINNLMTGKYGDPRSAKAKLQMLKEGKVLTFDDLDQQQFVKLFDAGNIEGAKNYLGEMLARETIFRYGHANHPSGWGSVYGRLFGQFGTWPVQYKDFLIAGATRGTTADKIQFLLTHGGINYAIIKAGGALGYNLESWVSYPSLQYTGGPWADIAMDLVKAHGGTEREQSMALKSLKFQFIPSMSDPRAIWIPTSYAVNDALKLFNSPPQLDEALGFRRIEVDVDESAILKL